MSRAIRVAGHSSAAAQRPALLPRNDFLARKLQGKFDVSSAIKDREKRFIEKGYAPHTAAEESGDWGDERQKAAGAGAPAGSGLLHIF